MKLYAAGKYSDRQTASFADYNKVGKMLSMLNERKEVLSWLAEDRFLMIDSGAHSWTKANINPVATHSIKSVLPPASEFIKEYEKIVIANKNKKAIFVELDVYGDLPKNIIDDMWKRIMDAGGTSQFIRVYHPFIDDGSLEEFDKWIEEGQDYIGISNDSEYLFNKIFSRTKNKIKLHGFAMTKSKVLYDYPFYSVDSTSWNSMSMHGLVLDWSPPKNCLCQTKLDMPEHDHNLFILAMRVRGANDGQDEIVNKWNFSQFESFGNFFTELWEKRGVVWHE